MPGEADGILVKMSLERGHSTVHRGQLRHDRAPRAPGWRARMAHELVARHPLDCKRWTVKSVQADPC